MQDDFAKIKDEILNSGLNLYGAESLTGESMAFIVDGKETVDRMRENDFPCVCFDKWDSAFVKVLSGLDVYLFTKKTIKGKLDGVANRIIVGDPDKLRAALDGDNPAVAVSKVAEAAEKEEQAKHDVFLQFGFYSVPDLTEEEKRPPEFIIEGLLPCGMTFLSGAPKIRKSFFALQLAIAVATGQDFFGKKTKQCDVVYLDLEGSKSRISTRSAQMTTPIPHNVFITNRVEEKLSNGLVDKLRELHHQRPRIRLIIIDTYSRARGNYRGGGGANAYDQDVAFLEPIQRMALDENIAILFIHHDKKGAGFMSDSFERISGTMGISGSADCVMNLVAEGKRFEGKATLEVNPRDAAGCELKLVFDGRFGEWQEVVESQPDLLGDPVCNWIMSNIPEKGKEGLFFPYETVYAQAYKANIDKPGEKIRERVQLNRDELFSAFGIGVQIGVQSHGRRGIRIINLL